MIAQLRAIVRALLPCVMLVIASVAVAAEIVPPRLIGDPAPVYPEGATGDAEVRLSLVVGEDGAVRDASVVEGAAPFDAAALQFVRGLRFDPATADGVPAAVEIAYTVRFIAPGPPKVDRTYEATVVGKREAEAVAAGDFSIDPQAFEEVPRRNAEQLLTLAPGVLLRNHQGEGHASSIFLRGFDAGEGQDIEFLLDGVPLNEISNPHGHGYADTHFIIPELVDELRVIEGPFAPEQGDFAVAGTAAYRLGLRERGLRIEGGYGSWNAQQVLLLWGPEKREAGTFVGARLRRGDGFGINRASSDATAMAGWEHSLGERTTLRLVGYSHASRFDSAGVIREDDYAAGRLPCGDGDDAQFYCTYDPNQGGAGSRHGAYALIERRTAARELRQLGFFSVRRLRLREDFTGWMLDEEQRGDGTEQIYSATTLGLRGELAFKRSWFGRRQRLSVGYDARYDDGQSTMRRLRRTGGEPYTRVFDNEVRVTHLGAWMGAQLRPLSWLGTSLGLRADAFYFDVTDLNRPTETRAGPREPTESIGSDGLALQPRAGTQVRLTDQLAWLSSAGVGVRSTDAAALSEGEFAPFARVQSAETGLSWRGDVAGWLPQARVVGFLTHVDRDLVFDQRLARNVFLGASSRYGALAAAGLQAERWLDLAGSVSWTEAHLVPADSGFFTFAEGPRLPYVPRWVGRLDAALRGEVPSVGDPLPARLGVGVTWVGARPLPLEQLGDPFLSIEAGGSIRYGSVELGLSAQNLFDARYHESEFYYASNFNGAEAIPSQMPVLHFAAGAPRTLMATLAVVLDPDEPEAPGPVPDGVEP